MASPYEGEIMGVQVPPRIPLLKPIFLLVIFFIICIISLSIFMKKKVKMLVKCCVCHKFKRKKGFIFSDRAHLDEWGHHHEDLAHMHLHYDVVFSHGYCPECAHKIMAEIDAADIRPIMP